MTKAEKKVAVAKDVLKNLRYTNLDGGTYLSTKNDANVDFLLENKDKDLQEFIPKIRKNCEVCAIGAFFLSEVGVFDKCKIAELGYDYSQLRNDTFMREKLRAVFTTKELSLIESAFMGSPYGITETEWPVTHSYYNKYHDEADRLKAICKNIIKNGTFKPEYQECYVN